MLQHNICIASAQHLIAYNMLLCITADAYPDNSTSTCSCTAHVAVTLSMHFFVHTYADTILCDAIYIYTSL
jgi:hypothetical protein